MKKQLQQQGVLLRSGKLNDKSVVVIGDVHGCVDALREILAQVYDTQCTVVFVGDLIDRGEDSDSVLRIVRALHKKPRSYGLKAVHVIRGNHEQMALEAYKESLSKLHRGPFYRSDYGLWKQNGGTDENFEFMCQNEMWSWLETLPLYYEHPTKIKMAKGHSKKLLVTHASVAANVPLDKQELTTLIWDRVIEGFGKDYLTVNGHTIKPNGRPVAYKTKTGDVLHIDTGSFFTGIVTGVTFVEEHIN